MRDKRVQAGTNESAEAVEARPWTERVWRPAGTVVAVGLALLLTWHAVNGQHGLSVWHQMRSEDKNLQKEIQQLEEENQQLRKQNMQLENDPEAIRHQARETLHYAGQDEVIYTLPASETK
ncbi:MAG: septum formation initiator family protein [Terracidiphilus sp.]|nr:septum formation initiator family protein [Terracidiphilus sp.]